MEFCVLLFIKCFREVFWTSTAIDNYAILLEALRKV